MELKNIYTKRFSKILNLQNEEQISYYLVEYKEKQLYGIAIKAENDDQIVMIKNKWESKNSVLNLIKFLYENSVRAQECEDIINDLAYRLY